MKCYDFRKQYSLAELIEIGCYKCKHDLQFSYNSNLGARGPRVFRCLTCDFVINALPKFRDLPVEEFLGYQIYYMTASGMWWQYNQTQVRVMHNHHVAFSLDQTHVAHKHMLNIKKILMLQ